MTGQARGHLDGLARETVFARVEADLARGHTHLATQRLASRIAAHPADLEARARRAWVSRQTGDWAEAGRWGFLSEEVTPAEIAAFERCFRNPWHRLRALRLRSDVGDALGPRASARWASLLAETVGETGEPVRWTETGPVWGARATGGARGRRGRRGRAGRAGRSSRRRENLSCAVVTLGLLIALTVLIVGVVTVARWLI